MGGTAKQKTNQGLNRQNFYRFIISVIILSGGGLLLYFDRATTLAIAAITSVVAFWFTRKD